VCVTGGAAGPAGSARDAEFETQDFSKIPDAAGVPYTYWGLGYTDRDTYLAAALAWLAP
jgi:predicted ATPase